MFVTPRLQQASRPALFIAIGDAYWIVGNKQKADELYTRVRQADISQSLNESAALGAQAVRDTVATPDRGPVLNK